MTAISAEPALGPGRRQHARAAREDPAPGTRRGDRGRPMAVPLVAGRSGSGSRSSVLVTRGDLRRLPAAVAHPAQVHRPGHDLPDRLPGRPGRVHVRRRRSRTSVTAIAAPRTTRSRRSRDRRSSRSPGSAEYVLTIATAGRRRDREPRQFLLYDPTTKAVQIGTPDGLTPCTDCVTTATGKVKSAGDLTILNLGQAAARSADVQAFSVPTDNGAIKASGVSKAYEGIADLDLRRGLRLHHRRGPGTSTPRTTPGAASSTPTGDGAAAGLAGQRRTRQLHPDVHRLRPSPGRSSASSAGTSRSPSSPWSRRSRPACSWRSP